MNKNNLQDFIIPDHLIKDTSCPNRFSTAFGLVLDSLKIGMTAKKGEPYHIPENKIIRVLKGHATYRINLIDYKLNPDTCILLPADSIIEVVDSSEDIAIEVLIVKALPALTDSICLKLPTQLLVFTPSDAFLKRFNSFLILIGMMIDSTTASDNTIAQTVMALYTDILEEYSVCCNSTTAEQYSKHNQIFNRFVALLNRYGHTERKLEFYAKRLNLSPNHLNTTIRDMTGMTVKDWVNRTTITKAKILLSQSGMKILDIAKELKFPESTAFVRFFRQLNGMTPLQYRNIARP